MLSTNDQPGLADASHYHAGELSVQLSANVVEEVGQRGRKMLTPLLVGCGMLEATASGRQTRVSITSVRRWRAVQESE
jgi:hypothetical protein